MAPLPSSEVLLERVALSLAILPEKKEEGLAPLQNARPSALLKPKSFRKLFATIAEIHGVVSILIIKANPGRGLCLSRVLVGAKRRERCGAIQMA